VNKPWKVVIDDGLYPNSSLCYGIGAHISDLIVQKNIILIYRAFKNHCNYNKLITKYQF
jgi:hypothetical protein